MMISKDKYDSLMKPIFRVRYSSMPPPNHKLPLDLDLDGIVKELTIGDQGYVLIPGIFTKEEVDMARSVLSKLIPIIIFHHFINHRETSLYLIETEGQYVSDVKVQLISLCVC